MAITEKTRKVLWARSGNRCAICRQELVQQSTELDDEAIVGEECHIIASESGGPRGKSPLPSGERDKPVNLILLCRNHHKVVDDQLNVFTIEILKKIKTKHESWVHEKLTTHKPEHAPIFFAYRIDTGTQFCNLLMGCDAYVLNNDPPQTREEAELIGDFVQTFQDYNDTWRDIESKDRVLAQFAFDEQIRTLSEEGFLVYAVERRERYRSTGIEKLVDFSTAYIFVLRKDNPKVRRKDDGVENLMGITGQNESQFTNTIPVMRSRSSVGFI